jgi:hypothetical protein
MEKPGIIVLSKDDEDTLRWLSMGWYTEEIEHTRKAKNLMAKAKKAIAVGVGVKDTIARLHKAGFKVIRSNSVELHFDPIKTALVKIKKQAGSLIYHWERTLELFLDEEGNVTDMDQRDEKIVEKIRHNIVLLRNALHGNDISVIRNLYKRVKKIGSPLFVMFTKSYS